METGCNLFLTKENIWQFDQLVADLQHVGMQEIIPCLYGFTPQYYCTTMLAVMER